MNRCRRLNGVLCAAVVIAAAVFPPRVCAEDRTAPDALYEKAAQAERSGDPELALQQYQAAILAGGSQSAVVNAWLRVAAIHMSRRADAEAQTALGEALKLDPRNVRANLMQARAFILQDKPGRAERLFDSLIREDEVSVEAAVGLAEAALARRDPERIAASVKRLRSIAGDSPDRRARAARSAREGSDFALSAGRPADAVALAGLAYSLDASPSNAEYLAMAHYQADELDRASDLFKELQSNPEHKQTASAMLGQIAVQRNETQMAAKRRRWQELQTLSREHEIAGRIDDAIRSYEEMLTFGRDLFGVEASDVDRKLESAKRRQGEKMSTMARSQAFDLMRAGRHAEAVTVLREAKTFSGPDLVLDGMLAEALQKQSPSLDRVGRESAMNEILALDGRLRAAGGALPSAVVAWAHAEIATMMEEQGRWKDAVSHLESALARSPAAPRLSRRLFAAKFRSRLPLLALFAAAFAGLIVLIRIRRPGIFRLIGATIRYRTALRRNNLDAQYRALTALAAITPGRVDYRLRLARMATDRGDTDVCLYLYENLRRERALDSTDLHRLFEMYEQRKESDKMYDVAKDILQSSPPAPIRVRVLESKFRFEMASNRAPDAFRTGMELLSSVGRPTAKLAADLAALAKSKDARPDISALLPIYRTWLRLDPSASEKIVRDAGPVISAAWPAAGRDIDPALRELSKLTVDLLKHSGQAQRAAEILERLREREPDPVPVLQDLRRIYTSIGDQDAALRSLRLLHEAEPSSLGFGLDYASQLESQGDDAGAMEVYLGMLPHHPNNVEMVRKLTDAARQYHDGDDPAGHDAAVRILRKVIAATLLDSRESRILLSRVLMKKGLTDEAIAILQAIEGGGYPKIRAQAIAAEAFLQKNQPGLASDLLSKVDFNDPQITEDLHKEMRYLLAGAYEAQGKTVDAAEIFDELILRDILYRDVKDRHERLSHVKRRRDAQAGCPSCGKPNALAARFCAHCGSQMPS